MEWTPLPIGVENFEEMITKGYYYVDKTLLIKDLIDLRGKVERENPAAYAPGTAGDQPVQPSPGI